jgi:hypothetical protein
MSFSRLRVFALIIFAAGVIWAQQTAVPLVIITDSLPPPSAGQPYRMELLATGGEPPLHWSIAEGKLPEGLSLDDSGVISGVPAEKGEETFTVAVTDSAEHAVRREFKLKVIAPLLIEWSQYPRVESDQIKGSVKVSNGTKDRFDLTVIIVAVNEYGKAFALGYRRFDLTPETSDVEIPFGSSLPRGAYVVHADAIAEVPEKHAIFRNRRQTPQPLVVSMP